MRDESRLIEEIADGKFHSGEVIAKSLGISRAMVCKRIQSLRKNQKLTIQSVKGRGYRLAQPLELLEIKTISDALSLATKESLDLHLHHTIDSTNSWLMGKASDGFPSGSVCIAEQQTAGRGRYGREWISPYGKNIYLSLLWRYPLSPTEVSGLSLAVGVTLLRVLRQIGLNDVGLKWPNDILWDGKKLAGLLLEVAGESCGPCHVVIGVGINTSIDEQSATAIDQPWVDLATIPGFTPVSRNRLVAMVLDALLTTLNGYQYGQLEPYLSDWKKFDLHYGKKVSLKSGNSEIVGVHQGIDRNGALLLTTADGTQTFHAGEVSLRPA
ncbi:MAG: bifunctional biotin--[acetyl-CoA-carboxylase] ligase/biotin operon repressor BirA [Candidatus Polarisedimenticolaceae bacterium]|nr:bifunctional biotin--[acetyl-CoA-carboxylase] ligase/biotin operon repressor BirA [Candidatus Polarisedimenticolaceae bacterium]